MEKNGTLDLAKIVSYQREFAAAREWDQFHTPKNLVMALSGEAGELLEIFQWLTEAQAKSVMAAPERATAVRHELSDVFFYLVRLCDVLGVDLESAFWEKQKLNQTRYPVERAKGNARKYTEWEEKD